MNYLNYHKLRYKNVSTCCHSSIYFVNLVQAKGYCFCYKKIVSLNNLHSLIIRIKTLTYRLSLNFEHGNSEVRNTSEESSKTMNCSENQPVINLFASIKLNNITWALLLKIQKHASRITFILPFIIDHFSTQKNRFPGFNFAMQRQKRDTSQKVVNQNPLFPKPLWLDDFLLSVPFREVTF